MSDKEDPSKNAPVKNIDTEQQKPDYPKEDKRKTARQEHLNGSTPKSNL